MGSRPPPPRPRRSFRVLVPFPASLSPRIRSRPRPDGPGSSRRRGGAASSSPALSGATGGSRASHRRLSPVSSLDAEERLQADGIRDADIKRLGRIGEDVKQLTQRARDNSFKPQVVRGMHWIAGWHVHGFKLGRSFWNGWHVNGFKLGRSFWN